MPTLREAVDDFLAQKRLAVAGVTRIKKAQPANLIYRKLRKAGYEVFPVNANAQEVEGDTCYPSLKAIPDGVDGVVIATSPSVTEDLVRDCAEAGITRVWIHRSIGKGSASTQAVDFCRENNITVIPAGCPMMYCKPIDPVHKCMCWAYTAFGRIPKNV